METKERISIKNLKKIKKKGFRLEHTLMLDDTPHTYQNNFGNAIRIDTFAGEDSDVELLYLLPYLESLGDHPNVRRVEKRGWRSTIKHPFHTTHPK